MLSKTLRRVKLRGFLDGVPQGANQEPIRHEARFQILQSLFITSFHQPLAPLCVSHTALLPLEAGKDLQPSAMASSLSLSSGRRSIKCGG